MKPTTIFLDIDDVCNTFTVSALQYVGCVISDESEYPREVGWDIVAAANRLDTSGGLSSSLFWSMLDRRFWATCPISEQFGWLVNRAARLVGRTNVCFLTSPPRAPDAAAGKLEWIQRYSPIWMHRQFLMGPCKYHCACPDALLIDDSDQQVNRFRQHGGQAVLVPRPWNSAHGQNVWDVLESVFDDAQHAESSAIVL